MFGAHRVIQLMAGLFAAVVLVMPVNGEAVQEIRPEVVEQTGLHYGSVKISAKSRLVAIAGTGQVYVFDLSTGLILRRIDADEAIDAAISDDERYLAIGGRGLVVIDLVSGETLISLGDKHLRINKIEAVKFSADGLWITAVNQSDYDDELTRAAVHQLPISLRKIDPNFKFTVAAVQQLSGRSVLTTCGMPAQLTMSNDGRHVACPTFGNDSSKIPSNKSSVLLDMVTGAKREFAPENFSAVTPDGRYVLDISVKDHIVKRYDISDPSKVQEAKLFPINNLNERRSEDHAVQSVGFRDSGEAVAFFGQHVQHISLNPLRVSRRDVRGDLDAPWRATNGQPVMDTEGRLILEFRPEPYQAPFKTGEESLFRLYDVDTLSQPPFRIIYGDIRDKGVGTIVKFTAQTTPQGVLLAQRFRDRAKVTNLTTGAVIYEHAGLRSIGEIMQIKAMVDPSGRKAYFGRGVGHFEEADVRTRLEKKAKGWVSDEMMEPELLKLSESVLVDFASGRQIPMPYKINSQRAKFSSKGKYFLGETLTRADEHAGSDMSYPHAVLISTDDGSVVHEWKPYTLMDVESCNFSNDEKRMSCHGEVYSIPDGKRLLDMEFKDLLRAAEAAMSPDGRWFMYTADFKTHILSVDSGKDIFVTQQSTWSYPSWGPDSRLIEKENGVTVIYALSSSGEISQTKLNIPDCTMPKLTGKGRVVCFIERNIGHLNWVSVHDEKTGNQLWRLPLQTNGGRPPITDDGQHMLLSTPGGVQVLLEIESSKIVNISVGADDWMITLPEGYYTSPRGVNKLIGIRKGNHVYAFDEFDLTLNRPDLVRERLGAPKALIKALNRAQAKRVQRFGVIDEASRPMVEFEQASLPLLTDDAQIKVAFNAEAIKGAKLTRAQVYVNGVPTLGRDGVAVTQDASGKVSQQLPVELTPGSNRIQVSVFDDKGIESLRDTGVVSRKAAPAPVTRYVLAVGVSQYQDATFNLDYAAKDANDLAAALQRGSPGIARTVVKTLTDAEVTRDKLRDARQFFADAKPQDQAIVFIAGHGLLDDKDDYYFAGYDIDPNQPAAKGVPIADIEDLFADTKARRRLLLMDSCHSGEVDHDMEQKLAALPPGVSGTRSLKLKTNTPKPANKDEGDSTQAVAYVTELFADLRRGVGATALASASGTELAMESSQYKNGLFTSALLEALNDPSTDTDGTRSIEMSELRDRVAARVRALSNGTQTPSTRVENYDENLLMSAWVEAKEEPVKAAAKGKGKKKK